MFEKVVVMSQLLTRTSAFFAEQVAQCQASAINIILLFS